MINIVRTKYGFAKVQASSKDWEDIILMVKHAVQIFNHTELRYELLGKEENQRQSLKNLIERLHVSKAPPLELPKYDIHSILCAIKAMDGHDVPALKTERKNALIEAISGYHVTDIFNDDIASDEQLKL